MQYRRYALRVMGRRVTPQLEMIQIDGRPASHYSLDEARRTLRSDGSHPLTVTESGGKKQKIQLDLPNM